jgi:hypothetical protein
VSDLRSYPVLHTGLGTKGLKLFGIDLLRWHDWWSQTRARVSEAAHHSPNDTAIFHLLRNRKWCDITNGNWVDTSPNLKPDNNHHLGRNSRPKYQQKHVRVYVRVCMHRKVRVAWPGWWPWRLGHININCGKVLHDDVACPNMASACYMITYINNKLLLVTWSNQNAPIYDNIGSQRSN